MNALPAVAAGRFRVDTGASEVAVVGRLVDADGGPAVDPLVVSDRPAGRTLVRTAGTSLGGVAIALVAIAVGAFLRLA